MTTDNSTDLSAESDDDDPDAPQGIRYPLSPDEDDEQVEGHGRQNPELPEDDDEDVEGHIHVKGS
jgi:hypothetical protein